MHLRHCCCCLTLLWRSVRAMGRFFSCFRVDDNHRRRHPHLSVAIRSRSASREALPRNQLSSLVEAEESEDAIVKDRENLIRRSVKLDTEEAELREEARFLKACGVLPETPAEIRKFSKKLSHDSSEQPKHQSWFPDNCLHENDKSPQDGPLTPTMLKPDWATESDPTDSATPNSCQRSELHISVNSPPTERETIDGCVITDANHQDDVTPPVMKSALVVPSSRTGRHRQKYVSWKLKSETSPVACLQNEENFDRSTTHKWPSPYPTPLKLSDDMETPGTVFAGESKNKAGIRSQYVRGGGVLNPLDQNLSYWKILEERVGVDNHSTFDDEVVDLGNNSQLKSSTEGSLYDYGNDDGKNQDGTPASGLMSSNWSEEEDEEVPFISPKRWDINGIPNTTTKYKEDQKVKWHATPFEERLEKALSEERRDVSPPEGSRWSGT